MEIINVEQGSPEWLALRHNYCTASEAPAALGQSKYTSRSALQKQKHSGIAEDVGAAKQALFDRGHDTEASARPLAEEIVGELYPITATRSVGGLDLLASLDGITMGDDIIFEHKLYSESLAEDVRAGTLAPHYTIQMDQQLLVTGASKCLFMTSDGTRERMAWCWYETTPEKTAALLQGWRQFLADCADYTPTEQVAEPVGRTPETLPALHIVLKGEVSASNLAEFKDVALTAIRSVNRDLKTDQDFADSAKARRWCEDIEARVAAAKDHALGQTATIDLLFRTMDEVSAEARDVRLALEKLEKARKESRKGEIVAGGVKALADHVAALNVRIGRAWLPPSGVDFGGAIKGLKSFASMQDAVDTALANTKIAASAAADRVEANMKTLAAAGHEFLFPDIGALVFKQPDDLAAVIASRTAANKEQEQKRIEAERERIRAEEEAKLRREHEAAERRRAGEEQASAAAALPPAAAPAPSVTPISPAVARQAVIEHQDVISAFLASRAWGRGEEQKARAVLVEFEKFKAGQPLRRAA